MKALILVLACLSLVGCAHIQMTEYHDQQFTLCSASRADADDWEDSAKAACHGQPMEIAAFRNSVATGTTQIRRTSWGHAEAKETHKTVTCHVYKCFGQALELN